MRVVVFLNKAATMWHAGVDQVDPCGADSRQEDHWVKMFSSAVLGRDKHKLDQGNSTDDSTKTELKTGLKYNLK